MLKATSKQVVLGGLGARAGIVGACLVAIVGCSAGVDAGGSESAAIPPTAGAAAFQAKSSASTLHEDKDALGTIETDGANAFGVGTTGGFFASLGTNGRTCNTCHVESSGWTITPAEAQALSNTDPLFTPNDGSDCPPTTATQRPNAALSSEVLNYGLIRVQIGIPDGADFSILSATNPKQCAIAPASAGANGQLFLFRRPIPTTNLVFDSAIMWDGRETIQKPNTTVGEQSQAALLFDLNDQANAATTGHAQGLPITGTQAQTDIVAFETNLFTAQSLMKFQHVSLSGDGASGGAAFLANTVAPSFFIGINDPLKAGFANANFNLYQAWEPTSATFDSLKKSEQAIGRGEALFNNTTFTIHDIPGLNSVPSNPLFNPNDPLAGKDIVGGCAVCHNNPNVGNHSTALAINIGLTLAHPVNADGTANTLLDIANLPVYTLTNGTNTVTVTDPGRALVTGHFVDVGKTKGPILRGLASRAPYFHNGSAPDLTTVVNFYNARFNIGLTPSQASDMVAFLQAL